MRSKDYYTSKIGEVSYTFYGGKMTIVEFMDTKNTVVESKKK